MRKHYIDNLRSLTILLLFPVHTLMIWNDFGNRFYIWMGENRLLSTLIISVNPWFMPLLFVLAGMSARYSLEKRTVRGYILQRTQKLLLPFILGVLLLVPLQTFYARRFFDAYAGGLLENWRYFFTHLTDFSGYDGAFTPGHLWFILFLFLISMISLPLFKYIPDQKAAEKIEKMSIWGIASLSIPLWIMYHIGNFGGFSIGKDLTLYLLGYYVISNNAVMETMEKNRRGLVISWCLGTGALVVLYYRFHYYGDLWIDLIGWICILTLLVLGKKYLDRTCRLLRSLNSASYPIYILHQTILVALAYYIAQLHTKIPIQISLICMGTFILTILAYHLIRRIPVVRKIIGIR